MALTLYRIENSQRSGPFTHPTAGLLLTSCTLPSPFSEGEPYEGLDSSYLPYAVKFAFLDMDVLHQWVGQYLPCLQQYGFQIIELTIPEDEMDSLILGDSGQVAFFEFR